MCWQLNFITEANTKNPDQTDLGLYCLQYRLPKNISRQEKQTTKVVTGRLRVHVILNDPNNNNSKFRGIYSV